MHKERLGHVGPQVQGADVFAGQYDVRAKVDQLGYQPAQRLMPKRIFCQVGGLRYKEAAVAMFLKLLIHRLHDSCVKSVAEKEAYSHSVVFQRDGGVTGYSR